MQLHHDPNWPRASAWLAGDHLPSPKAHLAVLGAPLNHSITLGSCYKAPVAIRAALKRFSPYDVEHDFDLRTIAVDDRGDLDIGKSTPEEAFEPLSDAVRSALQASDAAIIIGGDNGITRPGVHGLDLPLDRCGLITFDAHFDLRDLDGGLMNGNPIRALLKDGLPGPNIVQVGIQSFANSAAYAWVAFEAGIHVITADDVHSDGIQAIVEKALEMLDERTDAIYVDLDLDVMDRAFVPGTPGSRPGGIMPWQARRAAFLCGMHPKVRAMDLVEVDPETDIAATTCLNAGACLLSFASGLRARFEDTE